MTSFGEEIKRERELREISLRQVAEATKINLRYLSALESNDFEHLPGGVFNRGFVRSYAEVIGVDPDAMVNAYLLEEQAQRSQGKNRDGSVMRRPGGSGGSQRREAGPTPGLDPRLRLLLIVVLLSLVVLASLWGFQRFRRAGDAAPGKSATPPHSTGAPP